MIFFCYTMRENTERAGLRLNHRELGSFCFIQSLFIQPLGVKTSVILS